MRICLLVITLSVISASGVPRNQEQFQFVMLGIISKVWQATRKYIRTLEQRANELRRIRMLLMITFETGDFVNTYQVRGTKLIQLVVEDGVSPLFFASLKYLFIFVV